MIGRAVREPPPFFSESLQVEDVAGVGLASGRTTQRQRHLTIGDGLLGQVIVDDEHVTARVGGAGGLAVLAVVHEVLADGGTRHGGDVLQRRGVCRGGAHDDGVVESTVLGKRLANIRDRGGLLADGHVHADHALATLVDDGIDGDGGLAGLAVTDDELALAAADRDHRVDGEQTRLHGLAHRGALDDARGLELDGATMRLADAALAIDGLTKRVDDTTEHAATHGDVHNTTGGAAGVALLDGVDIAEQNGADLFAVEVLSQAVHGLARDGAGELKELTGHRAFETEDVSDTIAHLGYVGYFLGIDGSRQIIQALP